MRAHASQPSRHAKCGGARDPHDQSSNGGGMATMALASFTGQDSVAAMPPLA